MCAAPRAPPPPSTSPIFGRSLAGARAHCSALADDAASVAAISVAGIATMSNRIMRCPRGERPAMPVAAAIVVEIALRKNGAQRARARLNSRHANVSRLGGSHDLLRIGDAGGTRLR